LKSPLHRTLFAVLLALTATAGTDRPSPVQGPPLAALHRHKEIIIRERHGTQVTSSNWSGYAVTGAKNSVSDAKASWVVPAIAGNCPTAEQDASFWVGIDGYSSNTVEQIGTDSDCVNGVPVYYAWYEFYPHFSYTINTVPIKPGDVISAEVSANAKGAFTVTLTDEATRKLFSVSTKVPSAARSSAEWIIEAPYSGGVLPLADFNSVSYGADHTAISSTCDATVGTAHGPIGSFPPAEVFAITMTADNGATKSQPSMLSGDQSSVTDAWYNAGP
jgi:Peptidase A4 family